MCSLEYKKPLIESTLASAKLFYDDMRAKGLEEAKPQEAEPCGANETAGLSLSGIKKRLSSRKRKNEARMKELKIEEGVATADRDG